MQRWNVAAVAAACLLASPAVAEVEPLILSPSSPWHLEETGESCRLTRQFGADGRESAFYLEQLEPGDRFLVVVAGPDFRPESLDGVSLAFGPDGAIEHGNWLRRAFAAQYGLGLALHSFTLLGRSYESPENNLVAVGTVGYSEPRPQERLTPDAVKPITYFEMRKSGGGAVRLPLGSMSGPIKAMNECTDRMVERWGFDAEEQRDRTRTPKPATSPATWVSNADYPKNFASAGITASVNFRLTVDVKGHPSACTVQVQTGPAIMADKVCRLMMRNARFHPALDRSQQPLPSYWVSGVTFDLPS